uniref:Site-specific DNA-methyltransferase n=1 Tax=candidate division WOR-3 bacterium TaxID=2052148 RepID=A0A7V3ZWT4_UNCW3
MDIIQKFQEQLRKLFLFETSDLDFGIYRILNYKREMIEKFIKEDLVNKVESAFARYRDKSIEDVRQRLDEAKRKIIETLGDSAFTAGGELKSIYKDTNIGKEYLSVKEQEEVVEKIDEIKLQVFNDLYNFFSRYYEEGDFVPQYRYSIKAHKYAIPYNGEEVKLYWANAEQYYTKTGLLFRDYAFFTDASKSYKVVFRIVSAKEELGSNKATKERFFILDDEPVELKDKTLMIRFQYRELTDEEVKHYQVESGSNLAKQEKINQKSYEEVLKRLKAVELKALLSQDRNEKPLLWYQISRFTAKNTKDYFIHKNLKRFLSEQLDYFIKSEVLSIETLEKEMFLDKHITRAKVVREIGEAIIDFLSQIEDFQKRLWEKKKFVLKTEYVITTDRIPEEFYDEILRNEEQIKEWKELGFEIGNLNGNLKDKKLPVDTRYFSEEFKFRLLEKLTEEADLDDLLDGILIKSENWQALNLILGKYKGSVKTIYIDPPYNTGSDEFLYRDRYQHSSWLSMIENRLSLARKLMRDDGVIFVSIANNANVYKESYKLGLLMDNLFEKRFADLIWKRRSASGSYVITDITEIHEYILCYGRNNSSILMNILSPKKLKEYTHEDDKGKFKWHDLVIHQYTKEQRPNLFYGVAYNFVKNELDFEKTEKEINEKEEIMIYPSLDGKSVFTMTKESMKEVYERGVIGVIKEGKHYKIKIKKYLYDQSGIIIGDPLKSIIDDNEIPWEIKGTAQATKELKELLGTSFDTAKPTNLIKLLVYVSSLKNDLILDFFAGSGTTAHAVMKLNKEDGGKRKFILVEMADYFYSVIIPRVKKVAYSFNWKDGKPQDNDGIGVFFKYQILEQYEDALDNIELKENKKALELFKDEYLLKYFLDYETRESPYLLNMESLKNPFAYKLKVNLSEVGEPKELVVDIPETFNYLLGLKVKKIKQRQNEGKKYLFVLGEKEGKNIVVVWREYREDWKEEDFRKDKEFIGNETKGWQPSIVYVNGQSVLTPTVGEIRYIEPEFKRLMESGIV